MIEEFNKQEVEIGDKIRIKSSRYPWYWYNDKIGEVFEVKRYTGYDNNWIPSKVVVQRDGYNAQSLIELVDVELYEKGEKQMETESVSQLNVNEAIELLQGLLDYGYDPSTEIVLKHDSVRVNAFGKTFLVNNEYSLEDICKSIVKLSGAEL